MAISAADVRKLRDQTGAGMMDCKKALEATGGDIEAATDHLRKQGLKSADKKAGRATGEGRVFAVLGDEARTGSMVAVECETDFVARTPDFEALLQDLCAHIAGNRPGSVDEMLEQTWASSGVTVSEAMREVVGKLGENLQLAGVCYLENPEGLVGSYIHHNQKVGVLVSVKTAKSLDEAQGTLKTLCMHIAAKNPTARVRDEVPADVLEREKAIYRDEVKNKPEEIQEKIVGGKVDKYFADVALVEQPWVMDDSLSVEKALKQELGDDAEIQGFARFAVGN